MTETAKSSTFLLGDRRVHRMGYGAMQLAGKGVFGPPQSEEAALEVLREAVAGGVDHIDTSDYYGPHVTNQLIRAALLPYSPELTIVTKVGAVRGADRSWNPAQSTAELEQAVYDNLEHLGLETIEVVNLRRMDDHCVSEPSVEEQMTALAEMQRRGMIRHIGLSNVSAAQVAEARKTAPIVCVQNEYNLAKRKDDALIDALAADGIAFVPFFPLGGFTPLQSATLSQVAERVGASPLQVALAWLLARSANILLIPGTSSIHHLRENLAAAHLKLDEDAMRELNGIGRDLD